MPRTDPPAEHGSGTVLLVDDEDLVRSSTSDMLTDLGYRVVEAHSAEEALRRLDEEVQVDVLVTDHLMPGMTGTQLAAVARARRPGLPVLIISGYAEAEGVDPAFNRLTKPFRQGELAGSLAELLPARDGWQQLPVPIFLPVEEWRSSAPDCWPWEPPRPARPYWRRRQAF